MTDKKEPTLAPGQELTLHPGDPVRGADLLEQNLLEENLREQETEHPRRDSRLSRRTL